MKLKPKIFMKILVVSKKMFDFSSDSLKSKYIDSNKLVVSKMKDETAGV